ncbi:uncharacterized protein [Henckelia pumila]|uniref:uncharacterized protein n=1 Tax=Henckelia pumila TaxID=405737 RepID=UPI003C6E6B54
MSCIVWNVRGLGNQRAFRELKRLIADKKLSLLFLCETCKRDIVNNNWAILLGFKGCFSVGSRGYSGGLGLLWKEPLEVTIKSYSQGHIDCIEIHLQKIWRFTGFYGNPDSRLRSQSWSLLERLAGIHEFINTPWLIGGDFNEICFDSEKVGGNKRPAVQMERFRDVLDNCNLQSYYCDGDQFTWVNRRKDEELIFEKLDRYVSSFAWRILYPTARCYSLDFYHSDHRPLLMQLGSNSISPLDKNKMHDNICRFEAMWAREEDCERVIAAFWKISNAGVRGVEENIRQCASELKKWANTRFRSIPKRIKFKREQLAMIRTQEHWKAEVDRIRDWRMRLRT